jgi:hypothetical protein
MQTDLDYYLLINVVFIDVVLILIITEQFLKDKNQKRKNNGNN